MKKITKFLIKTHKEKNTSFLITMKSKIFTSMLCALVLSINICSGAISNISFGGSHKYGKNNYLSKPTGKYGVGFEDYHWINHNACPDPFFNGENKDDFIAVNKKHCHEIITRIYYPAISQDKKRSFYLPIKSQEQEILSKMSNVSKNSLQQFNTIKSYSIKKAEIVKGKKFPVLLFSPGLGFPAQMYENIITELVSHGYIVVSINTPFINYVELPDDHVVKVAKIESPISPEKEHKFVELPTLDLKYVYNKIHILRRSSILFSAMDLRHIGLFGHSIGAKASKDLALSNPNLFQALATLDGDAQATHKQFSFPFMDMMSAKVIRQEKNKSNSLFDSGNNSYLVVLSPNVDDTEYSYHLNFTDLSTLQYLPIYQAYKKYLKQHDKGSNRSFKVKFMSHDLTDKDQEELTTLTFIFVKKGNKWNAAIYEDKEKKGQPKINKIPGLSAALASLPDEQPEKFSESEIASIKKVLLPLFNHPPAGFLGTGNGWEITSSINIYLLNFFDTYLKGKKSQAFKNCAVLSKNTYIKCGPDEG